MVTLSINSYMIGELLKNIKENLFELYTKMSYSYYVSKNTGDFINLITEQPNRAIESFRQLIFGSHLINTIVLIILAFLMSSSFGILYNIGITFDFICKNEFIFTKLSRINAKENSGLNKWLIQILHGFKYLVSTNQIKNLKKIFSLRSIYLHQTKLNLEYSCIYSISERALAVVLIISIIYFISNL